MAGSLIPNMEVNIGSSSGVDSYLKAIAGLSNAMEAPFERARERDKLEKEQERYNTELGFKQRSEQRDVDKINMENKSKDALLNYNNNIARATTLGTMTDKQGSDLGNEFTSLVDGGKSEDEAAKIITDKANAFASADAKKLAESPSERANRIYQLEINGEGIDPTKLIDLKNQNVRDLKTEQDRLDDNLFKEKEFEESKRQHQDTVKYQNAQLAAAREERLYNRQKEQDAIIGETVANNNQFNKTDVAIGTGKKLLEEKGLNAEDQNNANTKASEKINNDSVIKQSQSNIEYASKYANQPTTQTGIDESYARLKTQGTGRTIDDINAEIKQLKSIDRSHMYGTHIYSDAKKEENINLKNTVDYDTKMKILELEKQKLDPNLTKDKFKTIVDSQNTLAEKSMNSNSLKIGERTKEYQNAAEAGMKRETDIYTDTKYLLSDKEVFDQFKQKALSDPNIGLIKDPIKREAYASKIANNAVNENSKNKEAYDKKIAEQKKLIEEKATKQEVEQMNQFEKAVNAKKNYYESLLKKDSEASDSDKIKAKLEYAEAQNSYNQYINNYISK